MAHGVNSAYHSGVPLDPVTSAIVGSIIGSAVEGLLAPAPLPPASGIVRALPVEAQYGLMTPPWNGQVQIDGQTRAVSPGLVIRNEFNQIVPPMMMQAPARVRYQIDANGFVYRVWILSAAEVQLAGQR